MISIIYIWESNVLLIWTSWEGMLHKRRAGINLELLIHAWMYEILVKLTNFEILINILISKVVQDLITINFYIYCSRIKKSLSKLLAY